MSKSGNVDPSESDVVLVTGGAMGIGKAVTQRFAGAGVRVWILDTAVEAGKRLSEECSPLAEFIEHDVTSEEAWSRLGQRIAEHGQFPRALVNNAGGLIAPFDIEGISLAQWRADIDLNLTSVFLGLSTILPIMREAGGGVVVNVSSVSGHRSQDDGIAYQAAKAGVDIVTKSVARAYAKYGIRVNSVLPSVVANAGSHGSDERLTGFLARVPMARPAFADEIAAVVYFLVSEDASYVTGTTLAADGGYLA
jgi:3alpha(or 20beta)-hydroxysteroid dehydrogenase